MIDGFSRRLENEVQDLSQPSQEIKVTAPPERKFSVWSGLYWPLFLLLKLWPSQRMSIMKSGQRLCTASVFRYCKEKKRAPMRRR